MSPQPAARVPQVGEYLLSLFQSIVVVPPVDPGCAATLGHPPKRRGFLVGGPCISG